MISLANEIVENCRTIQVGLSNTFVEENLPYKLRKSIDTRWLSKLYLISSIAVNIDELVRLKFTDDERIQHYITGKIESSINFINGHQKELKELIRLLMLFEEPIKIFQVVISLKF